jgi:uncharacterized protein YcnI
MARTVRVAAVLCGVAGAVALLASPAGAHVTPDETEVPADAFSAVTLSVPHGCEESPTRQLRIEIPEGIVSVTPQVHPGWEIEVEEEELDEPIEGEGDPITERIATVTYTAERGNELPAHFRDSFTLGYRAPDTPGEYLFFKTVQTCVEGETAWIEEYTGEGEEPEHPAPAVLVTDAQDDGHGGGDEAAGDDAGSAGGEEASATTDADDSTGLAVAAMVIGVLGLGTGVLALIRSQKPAGSAAN